MKKLLFLLFVLFIYTTAISQVDSVTYGISALTQGSGLYLSKIKASDGSVTRISGNAVVQNPGGPGRTIDPQHHVFYYTPDSVLLAFNLTTGDLIRKIPIINYLNSIFHGITYNCRDTTIYGIAVDVPGFSIKLAKLDPYTGLVTPVSANSLATSYSILTGTTLDPLHGIYYFETIGNPTNHLIGVDLRSGDMVTDTAIGIDPGDRFGPIVYNCHDSTLYGLAGNYTHGRRLAKINPASGIVTIISSYNVADTILNEQSTIDPFQQVFYFEGRENTYMGVSLNTGEFITLAYIAPLPGSFFTGFIFNHTCYFPSPSFMVENKIKPELTLFPNPAMDELNIHSLVPLLKAEILDFTGETVFSENFQGMKEIQIDLTNFPEGIYVVRIYDVNAWIAKKFVKISSGMHVEY